MLQFLLFQVYNGGDDGDEDVHAHSMEKEHLTSMSLSKLLQNAQQYAEVSPIYGLCGTAQFEPTFY